MRVSDFHFDLPEELIAQAPPEPRGSSRMLVLDRAGGLLKDDLFANLPHYLVEGDLLLLNNSRVIPARLFAVCGGLHTQANSPHPRGAIEVLLTQQLSANEWTALVRPSRKVVVGERLLFHAPGAPASLLEAEVIATADFGERTLRFHSDADFYDVLDRIGHIPLPPYIHRDDTPEDRYRYQTVFASEPGSAAAPTAGLHFTPEVLAALQAKGVVVETVTLHVGLGTFQPVRVEEVKDIHLHEERYTISPTAAQAVAAAQQAGKRIVAVGTTTTRTLEAGAARHPDSIVLPHSGTTSIFIAPSYKFQIVTGMVTNFHLPQSTLLMLVSAFAGRDAILSAYAHAIARRYRFFSYGDCMLIL